MVSTEELAVAEAEEQQQVLLEKEEVNGWVVDIFHKRFDSNIMSNLSILKDF